MAERTPDLTDVLLAAEARHEATLAATATGAHVASLRTAVRAARRRRTAFVAAAASVAVVLAGGALLWVPREAVEPAWPTPTASPTVPTTAAASPTPATAPGVASVEIGGLPPLQPATAEELRAAPVGSVLVLWTPGSIAALDSDAGPREVHLLLVGPDGERRHVARAPDNTVSLGPWDRATGRVGVSTAEGGGDSQTYDVDLLTGEATPREPSTDGLLPTSPDGTTVAVVENGVVTLVVGADERELPLPTRWCDAAGWSDATHLLLTCLDRAQRTLVPSEADGPALVLLDTVTGETTRRALFTGDVLPLRDSGVPLGDGSVAAAVDVVGRDVDEAEVARVCGTGFGRFGADLAGVTLPTVPAGDLLHRGLVPAGGRLVVAGPLGCPTDLTPSGVWALDLATGRVDELLPVHEAPDGPLGLVALTTWR
ncbi:hypothetical protein Cfla_3710 [Cellulomonas flavigena DSM 20109]|uniref:Uncharacterized protein n=1 Tax=Cellulomonas flavigena (strain ATCC 482 / DSM 20109 / BCRC 11376 / JCM 18109 / NBRC 3775 / NCIMB 8073 / NRS 134) TaxID=446466 RepID=D5UEA2_CELFN|nr:hypothetical protein [Cellulomonas flavigena]ADG76578.1 hypothetical protein Cfla_3710 [Cellulomonas flavigena DSM 20109]